MMGKNHLIVNTCSVTLAGLGVRLLVTEPQTELIEKWVVPVARTVSDYVSSLSTPMLMICLALFLLATLAPDIDNDKSTLGRWLSLPFEHRTWTHTAWFCMIFGAVAWFWRPFSAFLLGYILHIFWDSLSYGGVCWFYPISRYKSFGTEGKVKRRHLFKLYRVGQMSESVVVGVVCIATVYIVMLTIFNRI